MDDCRALFEKLISSEKIDSYTNFALFKAGWEARKPDVTVFREELTFEKAMSMIKKLQLKKHAKLGFYHDLLEIDNGKVVLTIRRKRSCSKIDHAARSN